MFCIKQFKTNYNKADFIMFDDQIDERQQLRAKVKRLQQEISQRARNYMQYNKLKNKANTIKTLQCQTQTDNISSLQEIEHRKIIINNQEWDKKPSPTCTNGFQQDWGSPRQNDHSTTPQYNIFKANNQETNQRQAKKEKQKLYSQQQNFQKDQVVKEILNIFQISESVHQQKIERLLQILNRDKRSQLNKIKMRKYKDQLQQKNKKIENLTEQIQRLNEKVDIESQQYKTSQTRCQFITKALNQSQQMNYQLRLKVQQCQIKLRNAAQVIQTDKIENYQKSIQQLKLKISQMEVMKKQYLRAYSKVKQQKEELQLAKADYLEKIQIANGKILQRYPGSKVQQQVQTIQHREDLRLKTIIQYSEDELIEQVFKNNSPGNSLTAIKQIIEHGLTETNRSTSQKWIKSALVKLQQFQRHQFEEHQKKVQDQQNVQKNLRQDCNNIVNSLKRTILKQKKMMQDSFNKAMNKMIQSMNQSKNQQIKNNKAKQVSLMNGKSLKSIIIVDSPVVHQQSQIENNVQIIHEACSQTIQKQQQKDNKQIKQKNQKENSQTLQLVVKLNQSHQRYGQLKKKYDILSQKLQQSNSRVAKDHKIKQDFKKFMDKVINVPIKTGKDPHTKFTEQFFDTLSHKIFQTLCNLPTGSHGQVYFVPSNQQQLADAVQVIYNFSLQFDEFQQNRLKQFKRQAQSLTKILQQIAVANQVSPERVIQSINQNLDEDNNTVTAPYVKSLLKKLSSEKPRKSRSMDDLMQQKKKQQQNDQKQTKVSEI